MTLHTSGPRPDSASVTSELAKLALLDHARDPARSYYRRLTTLGDEVLLAGAWMAMVEHDVVEREDYPELLEASRYGGVRLAAFKYFERKFEYELAAQVAAQTFESESNCQTDAMQGTLTRNTQKVFDAEKRRFLATGNLKILFDLMEQIERHSGWENAFPWAIRTILLTPHAPMAVVAAFNMLDIANRADLIHSIVERLGKNDLHPYLARLYKAVAVLQQGDLSEANRLLDTLVGVRHSGPDAMRAAAIVELRSRIRCLDAQGRFEEAHAKAVELNRLTVDKKADMTAFDRVARSLASLKIPQLPSDPRTRDFIMLGFPRSGTTLLENILSAHSDIATVEERPTLNAAVEYLGYYALRKMPLTPEICLAARTRYYTEIDRAMSRPDAAVRIDKTPLYSAHAKVLKALFEEKRYIFSIRHPFDVALSCFRQHFRPNTAMVHFHSMESTVKLYDFTMTEWFTRFGLNDPKVHYIRYDDLVQDFEQTVGRALDFLGTEWDDSVRTFATKASQRGARTPSYRKVRQGLTIGVQTYWRNYRFVFDAPETKPLRKWAEFFGYETN